MNEMTPESRDLRLRFVNEIRSKLSFEMKDMVENPAKYDNADVLDYIRDFCKNHQLQFLVKPQKDAPNILHVFVRDPLVEGLDLRAGSAHVNPCWLGFVEKNTEPTRDPT